MFLSFFYLLRARGLNPSAGEWMVLMQALDKGLAKPDLLSFYYLCRSILVTSESDYDKFDLAFLEFFEGVAASEDLNDQFIKWLTENRLMLDEERRLLEESIEHSLEELWRLFEERKREQKERHDGGSHWIGTGGTSPFGNSGYAKSGILAGGPGGQGRALQVAGERNFRDFRKDRIIDIRQFQTAFRKLRQYSSRVDSAKTELDIDETVEKTSDNAGRLTLSYEKPRRNTIKLLVMFDTGGSMLPYSRITSKLFSAVAGSDHFKDLQFYYFHNCVYDKLYTDPRARRGEWVDTEYALHRLDSDYRLILVGDASMAPSELTLRGGNTLIGLYNEIPGIDWLRTLRKHYEKSIWLNPVSEEYWTRAYGSVSIELVREIFPMYELSVDGLEAGIKKLLVSR
jgi:uncharacterized protein with von Willebrand factor type A (vWA) domain